MAFTYDPTTDRGKTRLLCWDNKTGTYLTDYNFTDADIDSFLEQNSDSVFLAAASACRTLAVKASAGAFLLTLTGALTLDRREVAKMYNDLADKYERRASSGPDVLTEYVDSFAYDVDLIGNDISEYIGD